MATVKTCNVTRALLTSCVPNNLTFETAACNVTRGLTSPSVTCGQAPMPEPCNVTRNLASLYVYPDQPLAIAACNVTRGSLSQSVARELEVMIAPCNVTRHLVYVSHFLPAAAEMAYVSHAMAQTIAACNVTRGSAQQNISPKSASVTGACNVTHTSPLFGTPENLTIRCINFASPPGGRKRQKDRPHTRPPRNPRGFLLGTQKTNFARLGQPGSDGRSAFGACK